MQTYDFLMLAVLAGLTLYGYAKGMAWQIAYLASLFASYFVARQFADQFAPAFGTTAPFNKFVAMLVIYIVTSLGIWMVFRVIRGAIDRVRLEAFDHQMGALLGFGRGVLWCVGLTFFAVTLLPAQHDAIMGSKSGRYIAMLLDKSDTLFPPEVHQVIGPYIERIERGLLPGGSSPFAGLPGLAGSAFPQQAFPQQGFPQQGYPQPQGFLQPSGSPQYPQGTQGFSQQPGAAQWPVAAEQNPSAWPSASTGWPNDPNIPPVGAAQPSAPWPR